MKKYIGLILIIIVCALLVAGSVFVFDSRDYFKEYFEAKRQKLNLMDEASVDSLRQVITTKTIMIDSLTSVVASKDETLDTYRNTIKEKETSITNLNNVIKHQNKIIDGLRNAEK